MDVEKVPALLRLQVYFWKRLTAAREWLGGKRPGALVGGSGPALLQSLSPSLRFSRPGPACSVVLSTLQQVSIIPCCVFFPGLPRSKNPTGSEVKPYSSLLPMPGIKQNAETLCREQGSC